VKESQNSQKRKNWSDVRLNGGYATHFRIRVKQVSALPVQVFFIYVFLLWRCL